jgi:hypothetical protein
MEQTKVVKKGTILKTNFLYMPDDANAEEWTVLTESEKISRSDSFEGRLVIESEPNFQVSQYYEIAKEPFPVCRIVSGPCSERISCSLEVLDSLFKREGFQFI